jgi:hypothetical protein
MPRQLLFFPAVLLVLLTGCATTPPLYWWGSYEPLIYSQYADPNEATTEHQIIKLEADIQKARAKNRALPPGFYAHLGTLYFQQGETELARRAFETEKAAFPESAVLMDRLLARLQEAPR